MALKHDQFCTTNPSQKRAFILIAIAGFIVLGGAEETLAHIPHHSPYHQGVNETAWAETATVIFGVGQLAGLAYLFAILIAYRRGLFPKNLGLALIIQLVIAVVLFFLSAFAYLAGAGMTKDFHLATHAYELVTVVRPEIAPQLIFANLITFALCVGLSWLLQLMFRPLRKTWTVPFVHTLVYHPLFFPVGIVVGLTHAIYIFRTGPPQHATED